MLTIAEIKYYGSLKQKKYRIQEEKFLIEGPHLIEECLNSDYILECVILNEKSAAVKYENLISLLKKKNIPLHKLKENLFSKIKETEHSQGIMGVVRQKKSGLSPDLSKANLLVALDRINDPGNLGTIIRTSYWFGVDGMLLSEDSVEIYNSKVLRSTQGALFHSNLYTNINLSSELSELKKGGYTIFLMTLDGPRTLQSVEFNTKAVFVFGNESEGISESILGKDFERVKIRGYSNCESLNVAVSCGIVLNHIRNLST